MSSNLRRHAFTVCQFIVRVCHQFGTFQQKGRFHEIGRFQSEWEIPSSEAALFVGDKYTLCVDGFRGPRPVGFGRATVSQRAVTLKLQLNPHSMNLVRPPRLAHGLPFQVQLDVSKFDYRLWTNEDPGLNHVLQCKIFGQVFLLDFTQVHSAV
jgi:hypothetical protein